MDLIQRPRRLRGSENLRKMVRETRMDKSSLIYPLFVKEGTGIEEEIPSMEGQFRYSVDRLPFELERLQNAGVNSIMLFGIPDHKDEVGSGAYDPNGIVQKALREAKKQFPEFTIRTISTCGIWSQMNSAISTSIAVAHPKLRPFSHAFSTLSFTSGKLWPRIIGPQESI